MSNRKVPLQKSIPFSWEASPGVSKIMFQDYPLDGRSSSIGAIPLSSFSSPKSQPRGSLESSSKDIRNIPLPPCPNLQPPPRRSTSLKGFRWWQDDPFLAAYKECTKNVKSCSKKNVGTRLKKTKLIFSCKNSCDIKEDNLVRLSKSNLHSIPSGRAPGKCVDNCGHSPF